MATVNLTLGIQAVAGPQMTFARSIEVEAYDKIEIKLDPGGNAAPEVPVEIQPGAATKVALLAIQSSVLGKEIVYRANGGGNNNSDPVALDQPQIFVGDAIALFGVDPIVLKFKNKFPAGDPTKKATIEIFVGRQAL